MRIKCLLFSLLALNLSIFAQRNVAVSGNIYDRVTTKDLLHVKVAVLNPDSSLVAETDAYVNRLIYDKGVYKEIESGLFRFDLPVKPEPYILRLSKDGYVTLQQPLDLSKITGRQFELKLPPIYMTPEAKNSAVDLDEVEVKTTKIKFYHKGDTLIYNADAFMLPEGSSLDALIAKLPGVEIRQGGKIYVNGRYVESLLLNGKDFFKGKQDILRQNLGAYTVKDIAVYDKTGQLSRLMETNIHDDMEYVMDVRLKKEYMGGYMGNAEGGYGTDDRYSARFFAMHFNNNARFALYGNANNVNNSDRPNSGEGREYSRGDNDLPGVSDTFNGGIDYLVEDPRKVWTVDGNIDARYVDNTFIKNTFTETFLQRNSFQTSLSHDRNKPFAFSTNHRLKLNKDLYYLNLNPDFSYNRTRSESGIASVEFDRNMQERYDIDKTVIDAIYTGTLQDLREALINRNRFNRKNRSNSYRAHLFSEQSLRFKGSPDAINLMVEGSYDRNHSAARTNQTIDYGFNGTDAPAESTALRREDKQYPAYTGWLRGALKYMIKSRKTLFALGYEYRHIVQRKSSLQFLADSHLEDEEALLPSDAELMPDLTNTNTSRQIANLHVIRGQFDYNTVLPSKATLSVYVAPEFHIRRRALSYNAFEAQETAMVPVMIPVRRTSSSFNDSQIIVQFRLPNGKFNLHSYYRFTTLYASLTDLIDIPNTTDPLNIFHGNPNLKDAFRQYVSLSCSSSPTRNSSISFSSSLDYQSRGLVKGYTFDTQSGVRDFRTVNVSGNMNTSYWLVYTNTFNFGVNSIDSYVNLTYEFARYANMIGEDGPMKKQVVYSNNFGYVVGCDYTLLGKYTIGAGFNSKNIFSRTHSNKGANNVERRMIPRGTIRLRLPYNLSFNCNLEYYIFKGTQNSSMNSNQCLLDASLNYQLNPNWSFRIHGHDLLDKQKPYNYIVSAAGITQTIVNNLPRYVMLTVSYKFNTKKKS